MANYQRGPGDIEWNNVVAEVFARDVNRCRAQRVFRVAEWQEFKMHAPRTLIATLDPAHVIPASKAGHMVYDVDNVVVMNRWSHDNLDHNRSPVNGKNLTKEEVHQWWARIVGVEKYKELLMRASRGPAMEEKDADNE